MMNGFEEFGFPFMPRITFTRPEPEIEKYIINKGATIIFWTDGTKTISKRHKEDVFDKELGYLLAYYYKKCGLSNNARKQVIDCIDFENLKTFLFWMYVKEEKTTPEKARKVLKNLKVKEN